MGIQLNGKKAVLILAVVFFLVFIITRGLEYITFGQNQADRELGPVKNDVKNHEVRLRSVEGDIREIRTLQREMKEDLKEIKEMVR